MKKTINLTLFIFLSSIFVSRAQGNIQAAHPLKTTWINNMIPINEQVAEKGFFLLKDWQIGDVVLNSGKVLNRVPIRYDIGNHMMHFKWNQKVKALYFQNIDYFIVYPTQGGQVKFSSCNLYNLNAPIKGFFRELNSGKNKALSLTRLKYVKSSSLLTPGGVNDNQDEYHKIRRLYVNIEDQVYELPFSRKKFTKLFGSRSDQILSFMKDRNLKFKQEKDLARIMIYFNQLIS